MIVTVTLNPAIDKTVDIAEFEYSGLNRIKSSVLDPGGKGINVSKTIRHLGGNTLATGFVGGSAGRIIEESLKELSIATDFIAVEGETRTNMKVVDAKGNVTEFNEPGPIIDSKSLEQLILKLEEVSRVA